MSDDQSPWRPNPGAPPSGFNPPQWSPPASPQPPYGAPPSSGDLAVSPPPAPPKSSKGKIIGSLVGVGALVAAGAFAVTQLSGDDEKGGAGSAQEVGTQLIASLEQEDVLGVIDLLLPGERETFREPLVKLVDELSRIEVLDDSATLDKIAGVDFKFTDITVDEEPTNVDDITNFVISGTEETTVDGAELPIGKLIIERAFGGDLPDLDQHTDPEHFDDLRLTAVQRDGRWYLSAFYTLAESSTGGAKIPAEGVTPVGADVPEGAVDNLLQSAVALDVEGVIAGLNPHEAEALQRYAPLFLAQTKGIGAGLGDVEISLTDTEYSVKGSGSSRDVGITGFTFTLTSDGDEVTATLADGCLTVELPGADPFDSCDANSIDEVLAAMGGDVPPEAVAAIGKLSVLVSSAFADYESTGLKVDQVDGKWYFSPIGTSSDFVLSVLAALDRDEIEGLIDGVTDFVATMSDLGFDAGELTPTMFDPRVLEGGLGDLSDKINDAGSTVPVAATPTTVSGETATTLATGDEGDQGDRFDLGALIKCSGMTDVNAGVACMQQGLADGKIDPILVGAPVAHPECGLANIYFDNTVYSLDDATFVAAVTAAAPCFQQLVQAGTVERYLVPAELLRPECLEGRNPNNYFDDKAYTERFNLCAYS